MIIELTEDSVKDFIKDGKVAIYYWMNGCSNCTKYAKTFESVSDSNKNYNFGKLFFNREDKVNLSEFKKTYIPEDSVNFPVTLVFEDGKLKDRYFGLLDKDELKKFLETGKAPDDKEKKLMGIYARKGWLITQVQKMNEELKAIDEQLAKLDQ